MTQQTTSTVNPTVPASNQGLNSATVRGNFQAAYNDLNVLFAGNGAFAATGAPAVRTSSDRANDFVRLVDYVPIGLGLKDAFPGARAALAAKGGGVLLLPNSDINLGSGVIYENGVYMRWEGQGPATRFISSSAAGPIVSLGQAGNITERCRLAHFTVQSTANTLSGPAVTAVRNNEGTVEDVQVIIGGAGGADACFIADGGALNYNTRFKGLRAYGIYRNGVIVGGTNQVGGFYMDGGWSFGGCSGAGILLVNVSGCSIDVGEVLSGSQGIATFPGPGQIVNCVQLGARVELDSCTNENVFISDNGGNVSNFVSTGLWAVSGLGSATNPAVRIGGSNANSISTIRFIGAMIGNRTGYGVVTGNCDDVIFSACAANGNVLGNYFIGDGGNHIRINGAARGQFAKYSPFGVVTATGITLNASTDYITLDYVDYTGCTTGLTNSSTGTHNKILT